MFFLLVLVEELFQITSKYVSVGKRVPMRRIDRMYLGLLGLCLCVIMFLFSLLGVELSTVSFAMRTLFHDETVYCLYI